MAGPTAKQFFLLLGGLFAVAGANACDGGQCGDAADNVLLLQSSLEVHSNPHEVAMAMTSFESRTSVENKSFGASLRQVCLDDANHTACWAAIIEINPNASSEFYTCTPFELGTPLFGGMAMPAGGLGCKAECGESPVFSRSIYKAGSSAICGNMEAAEDDYVPWAFNTYSELESSRSTATFFTFTREPINRFISGYAEIESRGEWASPLEVGSTERAHAFVDFVIRGQCRNMHVGPQINFLLHSYDCLATPFDFIGKLENFDDDWHTVEKQSGCDMPWDWGLGEHSHPSEEAADPMREVLSDPAVMRQLCEFYFVDYVIFEYELPEECTDMYDRSI